MTENVAQIVDEDFTRQEGFNDWLTDRLVRTLADRVITKIIQNGECICKYTEPRTINWVHTHQAEFRMGVDIRPLVRCKDCKWYGIYEAKKDGTPDERHNPSVCLKETYAKRRDPNWFCADGKEK